MENALWSKESLFTERAVYFQQQLKLMRQRKIPENFKKLVA